MKNVELDCVILWVDGNDPKWISEKEKYIKKSDSEKMDVSSSRYRDWGLLKFLFRGIEKNASFFRKIFFVTCGQVPEWLNTQHPKLKLVNHNEFMPEEYLPTFNSGAIELNLHRIKGLSDTFVYFNDDMFILRPMKKSDFFFRNKPCDSAVLNPFMIKENQSQVHFLVALNDIAIINKHFIKRDVIKNNFWGFFNVKYGKDVFRTLFLLIWKHFPGFLNYHLPYSLKKKYMNEVWEKEYNILHNTSLNKFRNIYDVNIWLILYWQFCKGDFFPRNPKIGVVCALNDNNENNKKIIDIVVNRKRKIIVINDEVETSNVKKIQNAIVKAFDKIYPEKSSYEQ